MFGGANAGIRNADLTLLAVSPGRLAWRPCPQAPGSSWPAARGATAAEVVGGRLYVCGGYGNVSGSGCCCCCLFSALPDQL